MRGPQRLSPAPQHPLRRPGSLSQAAPTLPRLPLPDVALRAHRRLPGHGREPPGPRHLSACGRDEATRATTLRSRAPSTRRMMHILK